jgi:hypothetical protein
VYSCGAVHLVNLDGAAGMDSTYHYMAAVNNTDVRFWDNIGGSYARQSGYDFPINNGACHVNPTKFTASNAHAFDGFKSLSPRAGMVTNYSSANFWTASSDRYWYGAYQWRRTSTGAHTTLSGRQRIVMTKRARLRMTATDIPVGDSTDPDYDAIRYPDSVRFFVGIGTANTEPALGSMWLQTDADESDTTIVIQDAVFSGSSAASEAATNTFPGSIGGLLRAGVGLRKDGRSKTQVQGDGGGWFDGLVPPGIIVAYGGITDPPGWLICDGRARSRALDIDLFTAIGVRYGSGDGTATFNIPDFRGIFLIGASGSKPLGSTGGAESTTIARANLPVTNVRWASDVPITGAGTRINNVSGIGGGGGTLETFGSGTPLDIMPPWRAANYIIKL